MMRAGHSLGAIVAAADDAGGVRRTDVRAGDWLIVKTRNSLYSIRFRPGGVCTVSGGWFDRRGHGPMETTVAGCTWGGSVIMVDVLAAIGLRIEFGNRLITTEARSIIHIHGAILN